ncbi:insulin-like [Aulostomus maculatus]
MASLWLQSASLLVLLVMSCPGTRAVASQHLCGSHLVEALHLVCGDKGFYYHPRRDIDAVLRFLPPKVGETVPAGGENEVPEFAFKDQMDMMMKRQGIVEQCCHKPCSIFDLENYCN